MQRIKSKGAWIAVAYDIHRGASPHQGERSDVIVRARTKRAVQKQLLQRFHCAPENIRVRKVGRALYRLTVIYGPDGHKIYFLLNESRVESAHRNEKGATSHV